MFNIRLAALREADSVYYAHASVDNVVACCQVMTILMKDGKNVFPLYQLKITTILRVTFDK